MEQSEASKILVVVYVLVVLFVGCIYIQGDLLSTPAAADTLKNLEIQYAGNANAGLKISASNALMILGLVTGFFAIAWRIQKVRGY